MHLTDPQIIQNLSYYLQLKWKGNEFYFYNEPADGEVNFVIREGLKIKELIQVCHNLDDLETREREIRSLIKASNQLKCSNLTIFTSDTEKIEKIKEKQINFIPLWKWLLL